MRSSFPPAHKAPKVQESKGCKISDRSEPVVGRVKGDGAGVYAGDDVLHALRAEPSGSNEDVVDVP